MNVFKKPVFCVLLIVCVAVSCDGQSLLCEVPVDLSAYYDSRDVVESYRIRDSNGNVSDLIFLSTRSLTAKRKLVYFKLNDKQKVVFEETLELENYYHSKVLGFNKSENFSTLLLSSTNSKLFFRAVFNSNDKTAVLEPIDIKLKKERFLTSYTNNGKTYMIGVPKMFSSKLNFYDLSRKKNHLVKELDFGAIRFRNHIKSYRISDILSSAGDRVEHIDYGKVRDVTDVMAKNKIYEQGDQLYLAFDNFSSGTQLITINKSDFSAGIKSFQHGAISTRLDESPKHNSFLYKDKLYQLVLDEDEMSFVVSDINSAEVVTSFHVSKKEDIPFRNGTAEQKGSLSLYGASKKKKLMKMAPFLRKMLGSQVGVYAYNQDNEIVVSLGGYATADNGVGIGYSSTSARSVVLQGLFDADSFDHIAGEISASIHDRIKEYIQNAEKDNSADNTLEFKQKITTRTSGYVLGHYNSETKKYQVLNFDF